jgi:hypothetical protein
VGDIFDLYDYAVAYPEAIPPAISTLVPDTLTVVKSGQAYSAADPDLPYGIFYLALLFESSDDPAEELLYEFLGDGITINSARNYGSRELTFGFGTGPGKVGNENINSVIDLGEAIRRAKQAHDLKRGIKAIKTPLPSVSGEEEEEEEEK